jgi:RNA polymerase sigma-70 factor (ECF subfamily)
LTGTFDNLVPLVDPPPEEGAEALSREDFLLTSSDNTLIAASGRGDVRAFSGLADRHLRSVMALAQRMTGNVADAEEVAQEAFLRLWRFAPAWDPYGPATVRTWLIRVAINQCLDRRRKKSFLPLDEAGEIADSAPGGYEKAEAAGKRRFLSALLQTLPERQRAVVVLSYYEGLKGQEIAETLGLSVKAVESLLVRARRGLHAKLVKQGILKSGDV